MFFGGGRRARGVSGGPGNKGIEDWVSPFLSFWSLERVLAGSE